MPAIIPIPAAPGATVLEYRSTHGSGMGWILEHLHPVLIAAIDVARSRGTGAERLRTLDTDRYQVVCAFGAGRARRWFTPPLIAQIHRVLELGGHVVVTDHVPGVYDAARRGAVAADALSLDALAACCAAAGFEVVSTIDLTEVGRTLVARKPAHAQAWS